ncbi:hypothetical protein SAMN05444161_4690 [Rhizobiales bacterium GAS191]|nr:hypothetical protein SAMN05519103_03982 [Rhizobiales bacterium GAS113]SEE03823.1 hypothetical protein SAMN05444161_4690 [Rhizobiales bacterium GAS191]
MTPTGVVGVRRKVVRNPYLDTYKEMTEYELTVWKQVFERSIAMKPSREKALRLRAIEQTLRTIETRKSRARVHLAPFGKGEHEGASVIERLEDSTVLQGDRL